MANTLRFKRGLVATIPTAAAGEPLFTTDTFDLYIGNGTTNTRFQKYIASGTTSQLLRGDGSLLTMPIVLTSPANGQVLKYNGTSWVNDSDSGITGSGAAGQVAYWSGTNTQVGNNNLFWDANNTRLGIGTNSPLFSLHVLGIGRFTGGLTSSTGFTQFAHYFYNGGGTNDIFASTTGNGAGSGNFGLVNTVVGSRFGLFASSTGRIVMGNDTQTTSTATNFVLYLNTGNVGINSTSDSGEKLQVNGTMKVTGNFVGGAIVSGTELRLNNNSFQRVAIGNASGGIAGGYNLTLSSGTAQHDSTGAISGYYYHNSGYIALYTNSSQAAGTTATERMRLDASGNLGIGTASPSRKLSVVGTTDIISYSNGTTTGYLYSDNNGVGLFNGATATGTGIYARTSNILDLYYNGSIGLRLNNLGRILIGSTTDSGEQLQVTGTAKITGASTFGGNVVISLNQNASTNFNVTNTDVGVNTKSEYVLVSRNGGTTKFGRYSNLTTAYKFINASDSYVLNETLGDFAILNDVASGNIKFAAGGSSTAHLTIASTGKVLYAAATTAKAQINLASGTAPTTPVDGDIWFDGTNLKMQIGGVTKTFTLI
jgi:hypothetical protein